MKRTPPVEMDSDSRRGTSHASNLPTKRGRPLHWASGCRRIQAISISHGQPSRSRDDRELGSTHFFVSPRIRLDQAKDKVGKYEFGVPRRNHLVSTRQDSVKPSKDEPAWQARVASFDTACARARRREVPRCPFQMFGYFLDSTHLPPIPLSCLLPALLAPIA